MATIEMPHIDLECGHRSPAVAGGAVTTEYEEEEEDELGRDCRICHMSLVSCSPTSGVAIDLGCCCKDDLAAAHKHCAETWFKIKGNKTCEICNSIAQNVVGPNEMEAGQAQEGVTESNVIGGLLSDTDSGVAAAAASRRRRRCSWLNGHRFLNFLLAFMVFAFVISWLFHFNLPS